MLEVIQLDFDYADRPLLQGINVVVSPGSLLHLKGANGRGKTTLLKLIAGLIHPKEGTIQYQHQSILKDLAHYHRQICYVGHKSGVNQWLTPRENLRFDPHFSVTHSDEEFMQRFSLQGYEDMPCAFLSEGQRRRVGLMRLLFSQANLWLLDEPFTALDTGAVEALMSCLQNHLEKGGQIVLTSHQPLPFKLEGYQEYHL
jgi:heme exporter protein A